jgi:hypothetical protein
MKLNKLSKSLPFQFIDMRVELWAKPCGIYLRCYLECLGKQLEDLGKSFGDLMRTW